MFQIKLFSLICKVSIQNNIMKKYVYQIFQGKAGQPDCTEISRSTKKLPSSYWEVHGVQDALYASDENC